MTRYELPELPYKYDALEPAYSSELLELHHGKHHAAYVNGANKVLEKLAEARDEGDFESINQMQKNLAFNLSGHVMHSLFWKTIGPDGGSGPTGGLETALERDFGSVDAFRSQFSEAAASIQGSGWAALAWDPLGELLLVQQVFDHQGNIGNGTLPIMVLDMWEHAFYLQYRNEKQTWIDAFWELARWDNVAARFENVREFDLEL